MVTECTITIMITECMITINEHTITVTDWSSRDKFDLNWYMKVG